MIPPVLIAMVSGAILIVMEGLTPRGLLMIALLAPFFYLGAEILARKITLESEGLTISKLLRSQQVTWSEIQSVDAVRSGNKFFLILQNKNGKPVIITNTIGPFKDLVDSIIENVSPNKISDQVIQLLSAPPTKWGPMIQAWIVAIILLGIIIGKFLGYDH
jgi:hypothetical protein